MTAVKVYNAADINVKGINFVEGNNDVYVHTKGNNTTNKNTTEGLSTTIYRP